MRKSTGKNLKGAVSVKKSGKAAKGQTKAAEYVNHLWELHKLQGVLLGHLRKEV